MLDIKHIARVLYDNRSDPDYKTGEGRRRILAKNGEKVAQGTFEKRIKEINAEISRLHDIEFSQNSKEASKQDLAKIISMHDYVLTLKRVMDGEPVNGKQPGIKDVLQAGKQAAEFFGWDQHNSNTIEDLANTIQKDGNKTIIKIRMKGKI